MSRKQWKTTIHIGDHRESMQFESETLAGLRAQVAMWLREQQPPKFSAVGSHGFYFSDQPSVKTPPFGSPRSVRADAAADTPTVDHAELEWVKAHPWHHLGERSYRPSVTLEEAIAAFVEDIIVPEKGSEWKNLLVNEQGIFEPHRIQTWRREDRPERINDYLSRGWLVFAHERSTSGHGDETVSAVLVHPELNAR